MAILRPFNTFGPRQSARAIIPTIISQALTRPVVRLGRLDPRRDLTYVKDTVSGFRRDRRLRRGARPGREHRPGRRTSRSASWSSGSATLLGRADRGRDRRRSGSGPPPARSSGCSPARLWRRSSGAGSRATPSTRGSTRRSPGSATTSTGSGSTTTRPDRLRGRPGLRRMARMLGKSRIVRAELRRVEIAASARDRS